MESFFLAEVTLARAINAEEKAAYEAEVAKANEEEREDPGEAVLLGLPGAHVPEPLQRLEGRAEVAEGAVARRAAEADRQPLDLIGKFCKILLFDIICKISQIFGGLVLGCIKTSKISFLAKLTNKLLELYDY